MKSFSLISAFALAAGASAQYSAASVLTPVPTSIPGGCNPAHPGSCPSSYFQTIPSSATLPASKPASSVPTGGITTTITAHAGCPTGPAPDVIVTRSNVPIPSCEAGKNATKPSIMSMPGYGPPAQSGSGSGSGSGNSTKASGTSTGTLPQFTGAAGRNVASVAFVVLGGVAAHLL